LQRNLQRYLVLDAKITVPGGFYIEICDMDTCRFVRAWELALVEAFDGALPKRYQINFNPS